MFTSIVRLFTIFFLTETRDVLHEQSKWIFIGAVLMVGAGSFTEFGLPLAGVDIVPLTSFGMLCFEVLVGYSIIKHNLLTIPQLRRFFCRSLRLS